ncbi:hypothetical protein KR222_006795, partial [Zaprionus bogoriensis]
AEPNERTPLLADRTGSSFASGSSSSSSTSTSIYAKECLNWRTIGLLVMFTSALALATYLLWQETAHLPDMGYKLSLIRHELWSRRHLHGQPRLRAQQVLNVYVTHTASVECSEDCAELLHQLQRAQAEQEQELPYNFLIAGDCEVYEARGWQYASAYATLPQAESLVLAFVGDFSRRQPSSCQLQLAQALLWESLRRGKLQSNYRLYALRNVTRSARDADALQHQLKRWPLYAGQQRVQ